MGPAGAGKASVANTEGIRPRWEVLAGGFTVRRGHRETGKTRNRSFWRTWRMILRSLEWEQFLVIAMRLSRRDLLAGTALALLGGLPGRAAVIRDHLPWEPNAGNPPVAAKPGPWLFFTGPEGRAVEALADR